MAAGLAAAVDQLPADPDLALIAICTKAEAADDRSMAVWDAAAHFPPKDPRVSVAFDESNRIYNVCRNGMGQAALMQPSTPAGWQAKASLALREFCCEDEAHLPLVRSVLMQLAGRSV